MTNNKKIYVLLRLNNNYMRQYILIITAFVFLVGCSNTDSTEDLTISNSNQTLTLSDDSYTWDSSVREDSIEISTSGSWTISSNVEWCAPIKSSGTGATTLPLWVSPNITSTQRTGALTLTLGTTTKTINLTQPAYSSSSAYVYYLPVIFHVMYNNSANDTLNVEKNWLGRVLKVVNKLYSYNNANIQFEMAKYDEDGNTLSEPGVMRHQVTFSNYDCEKFLSSNYSDNQKYGNYCQNLKKYINIYVYRFSDDDIMGISDLAITSTSNPLDSLPQTDYFNNRTHISYPYGVCINNKYIYETEDDGYYNESFIVTTLAHELGHYVGLLHTFSENECEEDDACSDTKDCDYNEYVDNLETRIKQLEKNSQDNTLSLDSVALRYDCADGSTYIADNIMDYAYCRSDTLSEEQLARTKYVLNYGPLTPGPKLVTYKTSDTKAITNTSFVPHISNCPPKPNNNHPSTRSGSNALSTIKSKYPFSVKIQ